MKKRYLFLILLIAGSLQLKSQIPEKITGFSDIKLSYNISFISDDPFFTRYGAGFELSYSLGNRFSFDFGITIRPTKKQIEDSFHWGDWGFPNVQIHRESSAFFMDAPIHFNYQLFKTKTFKILISSGPRSTYFNIKNNLTRIYDNQDPLYYDSKSNNISIGLDFGFVECLKLTNKIGVFASQFYGHYLIGDASGFKSTDLKIGLTYRFK